MGDPAKHVAGARNRPEVEAEWRAAPAHVVAEIIGGVLHTMPRPARRHTIAASNLGEELGPPFKRGRGGPGGWVNLDEPELHLGSMPDIVVPDLAGWRRQRMPDAIGDDSAPPYYDLAPDWVCVHHGAARVRVEPFDAIELDLAILWAG